MFSSLSWEQNIAVAALRLHQKDVLVLTVPLLSVSDAFTLEALLTRGS